MGPEKHGFNSVPKHSVRQIQTNLDKSEPKAKRLGSINLEQLCKKASLSLKIDDKKNCITDHISDGILGHYIPSDEFNYKIDINLQSCFEYVVSTNRTTHVSEVRNTHLLASHRKNVSPR